jgi:hypothetical protein
VLEGYGGLGRLGRLVLFYDIGDLEDWGLGWLRRLVLFYKIGDEED